MCLITAEMTPEYIDRIHSRAVGWQVEQHTNLPFAVPTTPPPHRSDVASVKIVPVDCLSKKAYNNSPPLFSSFLFTDQDDVVSSVVVAGS